LKTLIISIITLLMILESEKKTGVMSLEPYVSDVIGSRFEKMRNGHRFENWTPI
jgi:hypothetical protein